MGITSTLIDHTEQGLNNVLPSQTSDTQIQAGKLRFGLKCRQKLEPNNCIP